MPKYVPMQKHYDVLIMGSGAAGLTLALHLPKNLNIAVLSKGPLTDSSSTFWAQGGISAVLDDGDSFDSHTEDTLNAGAGLCHREVDFISAIRIKASVAASGFVNARAV